MTGVYQEEDDLTPGPLWHVVETRGGKEEKAAKSLLDQGLEVFLPRYSVMVKNGRYKRTEKSYALFPRYLFAEFDYAEFGSRVGNSRGVLRIVKFGGVPATVDASMIDALRLEVRMPRARALNTHSFKAGDSVEVSDEYFAGGCFNGVKGIIERLKDERVASVLLYAMGTVRMDIEIDSLTRAEPVIQQNVIPEASSAGIYL